MNSDDPTLPSEPTVAFGFRPTPQDEPSFGSAPTMVPGGASTPCEPQSLGRIDQYELIRKLGGGGFGVVYLARDTVSGIDVALKTLHPLMKANAEEMERLREKFALVSRLSHPNSASALVLHPVREVMITDAAVWHELRLSPGDSVMVMRYAPGVTLSQWRRQFKGRANPGRGRSPSAPPSVPLPLVLEIGRQIAAALDYAHGERIVHRDIKPANVMVETLGVESHTEAQRHREGGASSPSEPSSEHSVSSVVEKQRIRVRILDFGLAAEIRSSMSRVSSETGDTSGTRPYMAPEQWLGRKQDGRTDQYALACVLYELLSGAPPFAGVFETGDPTIMMAAVKNEAPEEIEGVSPAVNAALLKALAKNPKERFASCAEFVAGCLAQSPQSSQREPHTEAQRHGGAPQGGATSPLPASPARPEVSPHQAEPQKKSRKGWLVAALGVVAVVAAAWFELSRNGGVSSGRGRSPSAPPPVEARASSPATQDGAAEYERRIPEERKAREEAERKAEFERNARLETERKAAEYERRIAEERKAREEAERKAREHGGVQLWEGGPYWAGTNIGAEKPEKYGLYFWWGDTVGYRREGGAWVASDGSSRNFEFSDENTPTYGKGYATLQREGWITSAGVLAPEHDAAHVHWGGGWRMPTKQELDGLGSKCDWTWTTRNGVDGYVVRGRGDYSEASIFLPAAGYGYGTSLYYAGSYGDYWSSVPYSSNSSNAGYLYFNSGYHDADYSSYRYYGQSVRPVQGFAK